MLRIKRVLHHACWFALLGPQIGAFSTLSLLAIFESMFYEVISVLPFIIFFAWINGALPALLTGTVVALLTPRLHNCLPVRLTAGSMMGASLSLVASLTGLAPVTGDYSLDQVLTVQSFIFVISPGLVAGLMMSMLITRLPGTVAD